MQSATGERYVLIETAFGACGLAWSEHGLTRLQLPEIDPAATEERLRATGRERAADEVPETIRDLQGRLQRYFDGAAIDFSDVAIDARGQGDLQRRIYAAVRAIPWGETRTYGEIAKAIGEPGAARVVGQAMGRNPVPIIMPCHRVLAASGRLGGFSAPGGGATKQRLLALEGDRASAAPLLALMAQEPPCRPR